MSNEAGPRDWLSGGRFWDEIPVSGSSAPPPRPPITSFRPAQSRPRRRGSWIWSLLAVMLGCGALYSLYAASRWPERITPDLALIVGLLAILFGLVAWMRRRHPGTAGSVVFPTLAIAAGLLTILTFAAMSGVFPTLGTGTVAAVMPGVRQPAVPAAAPPAPAPAPAAASPAVSPQSAGPAPVNPPTQEPVRPEPNPMTMAQTLGTLQFVLAQTRGPDGLEPPVLGVTSGGGVFDPFSATPQQILIVLPANTTLRYTVSVDRHNYAVTLTDDANPALVARYDTVDGHVLLD